jgi:hypothetical protein
LLDFPGGPIDIRPEQPTAVLDAAVRIHAADLPLEDLRGWVASRNTAVAGLVGLLRLRSYFSDPTTTPNGWRDIGTQGSWLQPSVLAFAAMLDDHLASNPTVADTMEWLVHGRIIGVHETVAYGKLPDFTFRFRWELGRLRFYDNDPHRFGLTDVRRDAVVRISEDLGLWTREDGEPALSPAGTSFVQELFG